MTTLFVGRFQPLHYGHLSVIDWLTQQGKTEIVIGIGSSQYANTLDNPLSFTQRQNCFKLILPKLPIVALPDIHDDAHWIEHIRKLVYFAEIVSGNPVVRQLAQVSGIPVCQSPQTLTIDATTIRQLIRAHNPLWKQYVPASIHHYIEPIILGSSSAHASRAGSEA